MTIRSMRNRKERRCANEDLRVLRNELQERGSNNEHSGQSCNGTEIAQRFNELLTWILQLVSIGEENRASIIALRGDVERLKKTYDDLVKIAGTTTTGFDLDFRLDCLRSDIDSIIASVKSVRTASRHFNQEGALPTFNRRPSNRERGIFFCESLNGSRHKEANARIVSRVESTTETRS